MEKEFTFIGDMSTALDYARLRLNDTNNTITVDETGAPSPYLWDATIEALHDRYGVQEGTAMCAEIIATKVAPNISSFGEQGGIRFSVRNLYREYSELAAKIRAEVPWDEEEWSSPVTIGRIKAGSKNDPVDMTPYLRLEEWPQDPEVWGEVVVEDE